MQEAVAQAPVEFVRGWLSVEALPYGWFISRQSKGWTQSFENSVESHGQE